MLDLGIINQEFPFFGEFLSNTEQPTRNDDEAATDNAITSSIGTICGESRDKGSICSCPKRAEVPDPPKKLPFPCNPGNNARMWEWLISRFLNSIFNTFSVAYMDGPPVEIHLK